VRSDEREVALDLGHAELRELRLGIELARVGRPLRASLWSIWERQKCPTIGCRSFADCQGPK
jgi:hypothetical protein